MNESTRGVKYFEPGNRVVMYAGRKADEQYWDELWGEQKAELRYGPTPPKTSLVLEQTKNYLSVGSRVLEAGCGLALNSWHLHLAGYRPVALDFAPETIRYLREKVPEISPTLGDVRCLDFPAESFDGYWSLGVIEHFIDGWRDIALEMHRVLRRGGYLFVTFPSMSPVRRVLGRLGVYPLWDGSLRDSFYQYALHADDVRARLENVGFRCESTWRYLGLTGLEDALPVLSPVVGAMRSGGYAAKAIGAVLGRVAAPVIGHMTILVMQKR